VHSSDQIHWALIVALGLAAETTLAQRGDRPGETQRPLPAHLQPPPSPPLPPEQALRTIQIVDGFKVELFACEPIVQDPVALTFDEDGRVWVVEMRGFMPTIDGEGEDEPVGRVSVLEDVDGDGRADKSTVFLDGLVLPRAVAAVQGGALVAASGQLLFAKDIDGDLKADQTSVVDPDYAPRANLEHQPNGLLRGLDNWLYSANATWRYRFLDGKWTKEKTEFRGQWGLTQDDFGRLIYNVNNSQLRGDVTPPNYIGRNPHHKSASGLNLAIATDQRVFPIRMNTGVTRGYRTNVLDHLGRLREFTSACSPVIYRGDQFPAEFQGNAFVCEPAGNLIKRNLVIDQGLSLTSKLAYADREFLASTDERFRPVNAYSGPDGALWIVDMYRGILQHGEYITTYLRQQILARELDKHIHLGRIYRVVWAGASPTRPPKLSGESSTKLLELLAHPNGWWRDSAQRLLVERADPSVVPALVQLATKSKSLLARLHALWTLEGLRVANAAPLLPALDDQQVKVQVAAVRVIESLSAGDPRTQQALLSRLARLTERAAPELQFQVALTLGNLPKPEALPVLRQLASEQAGTPRLREAALSGLAGWELAFLEALLSSPDWRRERPGYAELLRALASAIVKERAPDKLQRLLSLVAKPRSGQAWIQEPLLAGLAENTKRQRLNPVELASQPLAWRALAENANPAVRAQLEKIGTLFSWPGHRPAAETMQAARPLDAEGRRLFALGRDWFFAACATCHGQRGDGIEPLAPPLVDSDWVLGPPERLARILLHGLQGPVHVNGTRYEPPLVLPEMPALAFLTDEQVAGALTYLRRAWGHQADAVSPDLVAQVRRDHTERQVPWTEEELLPGDAASAASARPRSE
jgi:mono/diheme cytochrome c family protein/glucose/arabinose dehydrogenase